MITITRTMDMHKQRKFIVSIHLGARWVKPTQPAEPMFLTPTLLMGALQATLASSIFYLRRSNSLVIQLI